MKRMILAGLTALAAITMTAAHAADLTRRHTMPAKAPAYIEPPFSWTGLYIGINGGYGWGSSTWDVLGVGSTDFNVSGAVVGGTLGYNWQMGSTVLGLEGDLDWSGIKGSTTSAVCPTASCETRNNWLATTRGRIGYAFGRMMPYVTGGAAFGDVKMSPAGVGSETETRVGWTLGGGVEAAIVGPWSAKLEYLYADLGKANCSAATCGTSTDVDLRTNLVRGGINYHF